MDLARWLRNSNSSEHDANGRSVVCATPPSLENGLLIETDPEALTCQGDQDDDAEDDDVTHQEEDGDNKSNNEDFIRLSSAQVQFVSAQLEGIESTLLHTKWTVDSVSLPYTCDAILVYELSEQHEALLESYPVRCQSEDQQATNNQQHQLNLSVKLSQGQLKRGRQYRLCLVLFEGGHDEEASLLPGCSHSMTWQTLQNNNNNAAVVVHHDREEDATTTATQITAFYANATTATVSVFMRIADAPSSCQFTVVVFENQRLLALERLNCSTTSFRFNKLQEGDSTGDQQSSNEYQVCATFDQQGQFLPPPSDGEREADGDIVLRPRSSIRNGNNNSTGTGPLSVEYQHCVVAKVAGRAWAVENTLVVIAVTVVFVLIAAALLLFTYLIARRIFFRRTKLWGSSISCDPLAGGFIHSSAGGANGSGSDGLPKTASRHILYVPENEDFFSNSSDSTSSSGFSSPDASHRQLETCTNV